MSDAVSSFNQIFITDVFQISILFFPSLFCTKLKCSFLGALGIVYPIIHNREKFTHLILAKTGELFKEKYSKFCGFNQYL